MDRLFPREDRAAGTGTWTCLGVGNTNDGQNESTGHYYICD
jgi:hypothetical protein